MSGEAREPWDDTAVTEAARRIASGESVDWSALGLNAGDDRSQAVLEKLQQVACIDSFHGGWHSQSTGDVRLPSKWGALTIIEQIGHGSFGQVYRAHDPGLDREVALKILDLGPNSDSDHARTVVDEGRCLARLRHPNIVAIHGAVRVNGRVSLEMELVAGRTLADIVRHQGPFAADEAALICRDVARALAAVHRAGLVHRDIKAQNVIRERGGRIVVMDFGAGRLADVIESAGLAGTPLYLAPEVLAGGPATLRADLYSLGVLMFHLVTDSFPVPATTIEELEHAHRLGPIVGLREMRPDLPDRFIHLVQRALASDPVNRIDSAGSFEAELSRVLGEVDGMGGAKGGNATTLNSIVRDHGPLSADEASLVGRKVCAALRVIHKSGRIHGAVTSRALLRSAGGALTLLDSDTVTGSDTDDAVYEAPENRTGTPKSSASDIYAAGVLLYFLVTGELPLSQERLRDTRPGLPESFVNVVERAMAPRPEDRFEIAERLATELSRTVSSVHFVPTVSGTTPSRTIWAVIAALVLVATFAIWWSPLGGSQDRADLIPQASVDMSHVISKLIVSDRSADVIRFYDPAAVGNVMPSVMLQGSATGLNQPYAVIYDREGRLFVASYSNDSIRIFSPDATGNTAPAATIEGPATLLSGPVGLVFDAEGRLYVANDAASRITVYARGAKGNAAPIQTIEGPKTGLAGPGGIALDREERLYVANTCCGTAARTVTVYSPRATGNVSPLATIAGPDTRLVRPHGIAVGPDGRVYVSNSLDDSIAVYGASPNGNVRPIALIKGPQTLMEGPQGISIDTAGNLYVVNAGTPSVLVFGAGANGDVAPMAVLAGPATGLEIPNFLTAVSRR